MPVAGGASIPPAAAPPKTNPWIIAVVAIVVSCCFCIGAIGLLLAFGEPILKGLGLLQAMLPALMV